MEAPLKVDTPRYKNMQLGYVFLSALPEPMQRLARLLKIVDDDQMVPIAWKDVDRLSGLDKLYDPNTHAFYALTEVEEVETVSHA